MRRLVSKKWDKRLEIVAFVIAVPMVMALLMDLADIATHFHGHFHEIYHAATVLLPLGILAWCVRMMLRERSGRRKR